MLDGFEILTTSGIVLWKRHYTTVPSNVVNSLINDVLIEERGAKARDTGGNNAPYRKDKYTVRWTTAGSLKEVGLVFVAVYQSLLHLSWVDSLLAAVKALFAKRYAAELKKPDGIAQLDCSSFDPAFDALVRKLDTGSTRTTSQTDSDAAELTPSSSAPSGGEECGDDDDMAPPPPSLPGAAQPRKTPSQPITVVDDTSTDATPVPTPDTSRPSTPSHAASHLLTAKAGPSKASRRARKAQSALSGSPVRASSGDEGSLSKKARGGKSTAKSKRMWDADGFAVDGDADDSQLDYSTADVRDGAGRQVDLDVDEVEASQMGSRTGKGQFVLKDLEDEVDAILASSKQSQITTRAYPESSSGLIGSASSKIGGLFRNVVGGKTLTKEDLQKPLQQMQNHLLEKNVAREAAERLVSSVEADLLNQKTASFTSIDATIRESMGRALTRILTPTSSLDLLRNITSTIEPPNGRPYVISIVGVNGVGKSTSLSKIAYFLLQNKFRVLVAAADTFRAGAVEQLRVHVRNLSELARRENVGTIELYDRGYGKDAAVIARDAVTYATNAGKGDMMYDVVLIDTAGRRHNDSRLMSSLTKFGQLANPDKIFMVGEALVGTDSVAQARNFAKEFVDQKGQLRNQGVGMDGFIISKCDTVGDMVGTLVSMVHATGIPVVFLGVGQHYGDLRGLNVSWAVDKLMR